MALRGRGSNIMPDNETNLDPFAFARADDDAEIFALRAELTGLEQRHTELYEQIDALPDAPYEQMPMCSLGSFLLTSDYEWHFARRGSIAAERDRVLAECRAIDARREAAE